MLACINIHHTDFVGMSTRYLQIS